MRPGQKLIRFYVPEEWHEQLTRGAKTQGISLADLMRLIVRGFMRNRLGDEERALLETRP